MNDNRLGDIVEVNTLVGDNMVVRNENQQTNKQTTKKNQSKTAHDRWKTNPNEQRWRVFLCSSQIDIPFVDFFFWFSFCICFIRFSLVYCICVCFVAICFVYYINFCCCCFVSALCSGATHFVLCVFVGSVLLLIYISRLSCSALSHFAIVAFMACMSFSWSVYLTLFLSPPPG